MSARYYLPLRHDVVAVNFFNAFRKLHHNQECKLNLNYPQETIITEGDFEYWWNISVKTTNRLPHNKPDLIIWNKKSKQCYIVEFSCPSDVNVTSKITEKENNYAPLIRNLQILYTDYKYTFTPIIVGALGTVPKSLKSNIEELGFSKKHTIRLIRKLQILSVSGTVKICKTFLRFS